MGRGLHYSFGRGLQQCEKGAVTMWERGFNNVGRGR